MNSNQIIEREKEFIDRISNYYRYDNNIRHLLYIIIPAFIIKYGVNREKLILKAFEGIRIISSEKENKIVKAYYSSTIQKIGEDYSTKKFMVIQNYKDIQLVDLLDNLVHEFNHAVNSYQNEIKVSSKYIYLRTGLTYRIYDKQSLNFIKKHSSYILEEIINTKQTSDIINIIKSFDSNNSLIGNTIYAINNETKSIYNSNSYYLQSYVCKEILENRTFISTLENLRLSGEVYELGKWFDDITGYKDSYKELNESLEEIYNLELKYVEQKLFKNRTASKIRDISKQILRIVEKFNQNVNFR